MSYTSAYLWSRASGETMRNLPYSGLPQVSFEDTWKVIYFLRKKINFLNHNHCCNLWERGHPATAPTKIATLIKSYENILYAIESLLLSGDHRIVHDGAPQGCLSPNEDECLPWEWAAFCEIIIFLDNGLFCEECHVINLRLR